MENQNSIHPLNRSQVEKTKAFKSLDNLNKGLVLKASNFNLLKHGYNVAKNTSVENWIGQTDLNRNNRNIILELLK